MNLKLKVVTIATLLLLGVIGASAQVTSGGALAVSATVQGSINLVFNSDGSGKALTSGAGTSTATLDFGTVSAYGSTCSTTGVLSGGVTCTLGSGNFTVSTPFDVQVSKANSASTNYTLTAQLGTTDNANTWKVAGATVVSGSAATITSTGSYGSNASNTLALTIPTTGTGSTPGTISNTLNFTATAN